jgi:hypothetical protein
MQQNETSDNPGQVNISLVPDLQEDRRQLELLNEDARDLLAGLSETQFNWAPAPGQWSIGECLDHLNVTNRELIKPLRAAINDARARGLTAQGPFRHGWLVNKFVRSMEPPVKRKFKAPAIFRPRPELSVIEVSREFFEVQDEVRQLIEEANGINLARVKIASPVSRFIKYSIGQAFDLIATHERRHLWQAREVKTQRSFPHLEAPG